MRFLCSVLLLQHSFVLGWGCTLQVRSAQDSLDRPLKLKQYDAMLRGNLAIEIVGHRPSRTSVAMIMMIVHDGKRRNHMG
ncbi:hypothetical protein DFJ58DRAFT_799782 [Suillus subalutaceus]|uniref:uncharacterized protein n=1 Tax=Suillus subalutaceus TaxID=48586 RepID=UPI001B879B84|nr:uncharacterized protein DFJ58DRAFT_799782 [Suillus subalutaceus]KAG1846083.1 hypothetical protein DFJ58DRAFT_799782 [Suillus subalutaceus]